MNRIFVVRIRDSTLLFSEEKFWNFCNKCKSHEWSFVFGEIDSNKPLVNPKKLSVKQFTEVFDIQKVKPLLKYKATTFGSHIIEDMPFFQRRVYQKFGERIGWNDEY